MSKVDWITWKTNPNEILNPEIIDNKIQDCFQDYNAYMNPVVYEQIKHEISNGILNKDSLEIMGETPAFKMANDIISKIEHIKIVIENLQVSIREEATEQKEVEKRQLIKEIEDKISSENDTLNNVINNETMQQHIKNIGGEVDYVIEILNDRINKLKERLEIAKSL